MPSQLDRNSPRTCHSSITLGLVSASQDELARIHPGEVFCCLEAKPCVGANYYDSLAREIGGFDRGYGGKLAVECLKDADFHDVGCSSGKSYKEI